MTSSRRLLAGFLTALALTAFANPLQSQETAPPLAVPQTQEYPASLKKDDPVTLNFPHASVVDILTFYEQLTGKKLIRDSNLQGPELSVSAPGPLSRKDAVSLIESSLLLNGYTLVPVDAATVKILGPSRPPRSEGLPLYVEESQLPADGDKLVSFYKPLRFLSPGEAVQVIDGVIQRNAYGSIAPVPNTSAIVITEKTPVIRKALALLEIVDQAPSQIITEFIPLQRASADKVVETLGQMFGGGGGAVPAAPQGGGGQQQQGGGAPPSRREERPTCWPARPSSSPTSEPTVSS
jgi:type II secretory pathway component GspD/PulD (secretin)